MPDLSLKARYRHGGGDSAAGGAPPAHNACAPDYSVGPRGRRFGPVRPPFGVRPDNPPTPGANGSAEAIGRRPPEAGGSVWPGSYCEAATLAACSALAWSSGVSAPSRTAWKPSFIAVLNSGGVRTSIL